MQNIALISGSIFAGNPITLQVTPSHLTGSNIAFHRIIVKVIASLVIDDEEITTPVTIPMSVSLFDEQPQKIDISSALRSVLDSFEYSPDTDDYPIVKWKVIGYDEYMQDGSVQTEYGKLSFPTPTTGIEKSNYAYCIAGRLSDAQRIALSDTPALSKLNTHPSSQCIFPVGRNFAISPNLTSAVSLLNSYNLTNPYSSLVSIASAGAKTLGGRNIYAVSETNANPRTVFRFINSLGVLDTISVPKEYQVNVGFQTKEYSSGKAETLNTIQRGIIRKSNNKETRYFSTDPLNEEWLYWFLNEFFMAENVWMEVVSGNQSSFVRCHILLDDDITAINRTSADAISLNFKVKLDINGHI